MSNKRVAETASQKAKRLRLDLDSAWEQIQDLHRRLDEERAAFDHQADIIELHERYLRVLESWGS